MPRNSSWSLEQERAYQRKYRAEHREKGLAYQRKWYAENRERIRARKAQWRAENPESLALYERRCNLKKKYGMSIEDYEKLAEIQGYRCLLCREKTKLVVDHSHDTDQVRGLLCANCNLLLGHARDSIPILEAAIKYLIGAQNDNGNAPGPTVKLK
jgi:predicted secreted protein